MEEGDLDGAADDGVDPKPPAGAEHGPGNTGAHDLPHQRQVVHGAARSLNRFFLRGGGVGVL